MKIVSLNLKMHHKQTCQCVHFEILFGFLIFLGMWSHIKTTLQALTGGFKKSFSLYTFNRWGIFIFKEVQFHFFRILIANFFFGSSTVCVDRLTFLIFMKPLFFSGYIHLGPHFLHWNRNPKSCITWYISETETNYVFYESGSW